MDSRLHVSTSPPQKKKTRPKKPVVKITIDPAKQHVPNKNNGRKGCVRPWTPQQITYQKGQFMSSTNPPPQTQLTPPSEQLCWFDRKGHFHPQGHYQPWPAAKVRLVLDENDPKCAARGWLAQIENCFARPEVTPSHLPLGRQGPPSNQVACFSSVSSRELTSVLQCKPTKTRNTQTTTQTNKQTNRQPGRQAGRQAGRQTAKQSERERSLKTKRDREKQELAQAHARSHSAPSQGAGPKRRVLTASLELEAACLC